MKSPNPMVQRNPIANYQVLRVCSNQEIHIVLSKEHISKTVKVSGLFLDLDEAIVYNNQGITRTIRQARCFALNKASTCFLGTITIDDSVNLLVYLESENIDKKDFVTLIDPYVETVRLKPHQVLEVVMTENAGWDWAWYPRNPTENSTCISLQEIGRRCFSPTVAKWNDQSESDPYFVDQKIRFKEPKTTLQSHFWFRFDSLMMSILQDDKLGRGHIAGSLVVFTRAEEEFACIDVLVDVDKKYVVPFGNTLTLGRYGPNYSYQSENKKTSKIHLHPDNKANDVGYEREWNWKKEKYSKNHYFNEDLVGSGEDDTWIIESNKLNKSHVVTTYKKQPKVVEKILMDVEISEVENPDLYEGCSTEEWPKTSAVIVEGSDCC